MDKLTEYLNKSGISFKQNELLKDYCSFKIGGIAKMIIYINNEKELKRIIKHLIKHNIKYFIIGNGTNILFSDLGFDGVIIKLSKTFNKIKFKNDIAYVSASVSLFGFIKKCAENGLSGIEALYGIPGSVGGGIKMNCGSFNQTISNCIKSVKVFNGKKTFWIKKSKLEFGYRTSIFFCKANYVVLGAKFKFVKGDRESIENRMLEAFNKKKEMQPYNSFSAGSVFKRNGEIAVSKIIDDMGLKGYEIGDAQISTKHSGFIVNKGNATCKDVINLIKYIQEKVYFGYGFIPQTEIEIIGEEDDIVR